MVKDYECEKCGLKSSFYSFRGTSEDGSYLKCFRCGSRRIKKLEDKDKEFD